MAGESAPAWVAQVVEESRGTDLNGFATITDLVKSYRDVGKERETLKTEYEGYRTKAVPIPGEGAKPEEVAAFHKALGVPDKPEGYTYKLPEGTPEDVLSPDEMKRVLSLAHKHHASPALVQELVNYEVETVMAARKAMKEENDTAIKAGDEYLIKKYGADKKDAKLADADKAIEKFGGKALKEELTRTGDGNRPLLMDAFIQIGALMSEKGPMGSGQGAGAGSEGTNFREIYPKSFQDGQMH
jgi:hypothetical protein